MNKRVIDLARMLLLGSMLSGCAVLESLTHDEPSAPETAPALPVAAPVAAGPTIRLPRDEGPFYPSQLRLAEGETAPVDGARLAMLADNATCASCHPSAATQHHAGPHANASFTNPWYRAVVERLRHDESTRESRHCAGCHDPLMLISGRMDREIEPSDPIAQAGVTCTVCHGITAATSDGNASYVLSTADPLIPDPNNADEVQRHVARMSPEVLRSPLLCGSCHRGFLGQEETHTGSFLPGIDELGPWRGSVFGGQHAQRIEPRAIAEFACRGCHMDAESATQEEFARNDEGMIASHRFAGGHTALAMNQPEQFARIAMRQQTAATIDVPAFTREDGTFVVLEHGDELPRGERVTLDVVVRNVGAGHRFPGGARDIRDHFVTLHIVDAEGREIADAARDYANGDAGDASAFALRTAVLDDEGRPDVEHLIHRFHALGWDHTITPRDALAVRYVVEIPPDAALPLTIVASLQARRHTLTFSRFACEDSRTERARAFDEAAHNAGMPLLDACAEEPVLRIASYVSTRESRPLWERLYEHAMALSHEVQEALHTSTRSAELARAALPPELTEHALAEAAILTLEADVAARTGQRDEALRLANEAESLAGAHPAIDRARGHAEAQVWRWENAAMAFGAVARAAPLDTEAHRDHARALGSLARGEETLAATALGLRLFPRDEQLLRSQALAIGDCADRGIAACTEAGLRERAQAAFLRYRRPDEETQLRLACEQDVDGCARDRLPIPRITLD
jgi:hypothetical protein